MVSKGCFIIKAFFLCFFLGIFGAHRLYMKDYLTFFLYFLTVGYCGVGVIIDDILILFCFIPRKKKTLVKLPNIISSLRSMAELSLPYCSLVA